MTENVTSSNTGSNFTAKYYYKKSNIVGNIFTVCVLFDKEKKMVARGVAICSVHDCHNKAIARKKSYKRALSATFKKNCSEEIIIDEKSLFECLVKDFKIKNPEQRDLMILELQEYDIDYEEKEFNGSQILRIEIPVTLPKEIALTYFKFKSEFNPEPTQEEVKMFHLS